MNALARIVVGGANITATTALQALNPNGREIALRRGSNVVMPILTAGEGAAGREGGAATGTSGGPGGRETLNMAL